MAKIIKPSNATEELVSKMVEEEFDRRVKEVCSPTYYKNQYLKYAFEHHATPQCINRTYLEMLKSGTQFSHDPSDLKHISLSLGRLVMISNEDYIEFLSQTREKLKRKIREQYPYLIVDAPGRIKSFKSSEVKIRTKILRDQVLKNYLNGIKSFGLVSSEEEEIAKNYLLRSLKINASSCIGDTFGIRFILYSHNRCTDEEHLTKFAFEYAEFVKDFFENKGFIIIGETDYISHPKENGYQSYHIRVNYGGIDLEIQIRTKQMHKHAESGDASFDEYKDTDIQNFTKDFLYQISGDAVDQNERMGILKEQTLDPTIWAFTPANEVPQTPDNIRAFEDMSFLKSIFD